MNGQCRGKLQALLTSLQTQSNQPTVDVKQIEEKMTEFFMVSLSIIYSLAFNVEKSSKNRGQHFTNLC